MNSKEDNPIHTIKTKSGKLPLESFLAPLVLIHYFTESVVLNHFGQIYVYKPSISIPPALHDQLKVNIWLVNIKAYIFR